MKIFLIIAISFVSMFAQVNLSKPKPTFEKPRLWMVRLYENEVHKVNYIVGGINNVLKEYPAETLNVVVVVYGPGMRVLKKDYDKKTLSRIKSLIDSDVEFVACKNTMKTMHWSKKDLIEDLNYVQASIAESIERIARGWIDVTPY